jgi:hypothetical protein
MQLFAAVHEQNDESRLMVHHQRLSDTNEDQLSLAAIHYLRSHFQVKPLHEHLRAVLHVKSCNG